MTRPASRHPASMADEAEEALMYLENAGVKLIRKGGRVTDNYCALLSGMPQEKGAVI